DPRPAAKPTDLRPNDAEVIRLLCQDPKRAALWNGDTSAHPSHSEADQSLTNHLAFFCGGDSAAVDSLFRQSGLFRAKWARPARSGQTYGEGTIERAIAGCSSFYSPRPNGHLRLAAHRENAPDCDSAAFDYDQAERMAIQGESDTRENDPAS